MMKDKKKLIIFYNPKSGNKNKKNKLLDLLKKYKNNIDYKIYNVEDSITNNIEIIKKANNDTRIIVAGGDGTVSSIVNLIKNMKKDIPIGILPFGTGNGLIRSIISESLIHYNLYNCFDTILNGDIRLIDCAKIKMNNDITTYSILSLSYGLVSYIDIDSEWLRTLGSFRFTLYGILGILLKKKYKARISFENKNNIETIEDEFSFIWISNCKYASEDVISSKNSLLNDGFYNLIFVRSNISRYTLTKILLSFENGNYIDYPEVETYKTTKIDFTPLDEKAKLVIDGELVESSNLELNIEPESIKIYG